MTMRILYQNFFQGKARGGHIPMPGYLLLQYIHLLLRISIQDSKRDMIDKEK